MIWKWSQSLQLLLVSPLFLHSTCAVYYYYYYTIWMFLVTGLLFPILLLNQRWSPPLRLQASHCSTFRVMCDVPSIAVFFSESIECFLGIASIFFFKPSVTIPVAPVITSMIAHFVFHIRCVSIHQLLYLTSFPLPFARHFCQRVLPHLSVSFFDFNYYIWLICYTFFVYYY